METSIGRGCAHGMPVLARKTAELVAGRLHYARHARALVTGINKTTDAVTLTYDPWGRARLDDAVGELECQGRRMVADREGVGADN